MKKKAVGILMIVSVLSLLLSGCMLPGATVNVSGTWHVTATYTPPNSTPVTILDEDMEFQQNGSNLTVEYVFQGTVNGNHVTFSLSYQGSTWSFDGTVNGNNMSGTWTLTGGTSNANGTWTAVKK
jgi:hypothetical protein